MTSKRILIASFATAFIGTMAFRISVPAVAFYTRISLKGTMLELGLLTTSFFAARAIAAVLAGELADKGLKLHILASSCFLIHSLVVMLYRLVRSWLSVVFLKALQGILNGLAWTSVQFVLGAAVKTEVRGRAYSVYFAFGSLGGFAGNIAYSLMPGTGLSKPIALSALAFSLSALTSMFLVSPSLTAGKSRRAKARNRSSIIRTRPEGSCLLAWISLMVFGSRAFASLLTGDVIYVYLSEALGISPSLASALVGFGSLVGLLASMAISWVADKKDDRLALSLAVGLSSAGALMTAIRHAALGVAGFLLLAMGVVSLMPLVRRLVMTYQRRRGLALGVVGAVGNVGTASSSVLFGGSLQLMGTSTVAVLGLEFVKAVLVVSLALLAVVFISVVEVRRALGLTR